MQVLLIGPVPPPITGVSLANSTIIDNIPTLHPEINVDFINTSLNTLKEDLGEFSISKIINYSKKYKEIYKIFQANKIYITPGQTFLGVIKYYPYLTMAKILKKEIIIHIHGDYLWQEYKQLSGIKRQIFKKFFSSANKGIVLSKSLRRNLTPFLPEYNIFELHNFVEDYLFDINISYKVKNHFKEIRIVYLSNLMKEKGILDLLEALLILKRKKIPFKAKIAGSLSDILRDTLHNYFTNIKNIKYLGVVSGIQKKKLLEWGNIFVFPTYYRMEGQPISILEAYATGNIVLTTKHAGIPDIFKDNINGFYIPKKNPLEIARKLEFLSKKIEDYKHIAINNHNEAKEKYTVEKFIINLTKILEE